MERRRLRSPSKGLLCGVLSAAMAVSMLSPIPGLGFASKVSAEDKGVTLNVESEVSVKIGDKTYPMSLYQNNLYEAKVDGLAAGDVTATLVVDGKDQAVTDKATVAEGTGSVYFQYKDGTLKDSADDGIISSETLVGYFNGIEFLKDSADETSRYDIQSWKPSDTNGDLDYVGGGIYKRTFYFKTLAAAVEVNDSGYKVAENHDWDTSYGNNGGNIACTIPAGATSITIMLNKNTGKVYDSVNTAVLPRETTDGISSLGLNCYLTGSKGIQADGEWTAGYAGNTFTRLDDKYFVFSKQFPANTYEYKVTYGDGKWSGWGNVSLKPAKDENVVFLYDAAADKMYDSVNNQQFVCEALGLTPATTTAEAKVMSNGMLSFVGAFEDGKKVKLYYLTKSALDKDANASFTEAEMTGKGNGRYESADLWTHDAKDTVYYYYTVDGNDANDAGAETTTIQGKKVQTLEKPEYKGRVVNVPGTLPTGEGSWDTNSNKMTYMGNQRYKLELKNVTGGTYEYKICIEGSWANGDYGLNGAAKGANISAVIEDGSDFTVYYNDISHKIVDSTNYVIADISLSGTGIPEGTKLTDDYFNGIYSATIDLTAGTYKDIKAIYDGKEYAYPAFTLKEAKAVTFYFDPVSLIYYNNASDEKVSTKDIFYDSKSLDYKSPFGAVATGEDVTFRIQTGDDVTEVKLVVKGVDKNTIALEKDGAPKDGAQMWKVTTKFDKIGENHYFFVVSNGSSIECYGDDDGYYGTGKVSDLSSVSAYDLIVYKSGYKTPDWMKNAVIYQIFPDRFADGDTSNDQAQTTSRGATNYEFITDWNTLPENPEQEALIGKEDGITEEQYKATGAWYGDTNWSNEMYGGDLQGVIQHIDYLKALGVNVIYFNPSFESISSHRYDTSDYSKIDPILGTEGDFAELVKVAKANGMHIIMDGVFNHVSDDSIYFDRYYKYLHKDGTTAVGAYPYWAYVYDYMKTESVDQATAEKAAKEYFTSKYNITDYSYTEWFAINNTPMYTDDDKTDTVKDTIGDRAGKAVYSYEGWWGYDSMPVIKSTNGSEYQSGNWGEKIIKSSDSSNPSITQYWLEKGSNGWRLDVANEVSDETWQHFRESVKALNDDNVVIGEIWTDATKYLLGDMYDSVMNYMFRGYAIDFANTDTSSDGYKTSDEVMKEMEKLRERYPKEAFYAMMNLVDSHDTTRILSYLDGIPDDRDDKSLAAAFPTYATTSDTAKQKQYLVALMQFTYAGAPTIYYGDEMGQVGADDPDDRRTTPWGEGNKELTLWYARLANIRNQYSALRTGTVEAFSTGNDSLLGYVRGDDSNRLLVLLNRSDKDVSYTVDDLAKLSLTGATFTDLITRSAFTVADGKLSVTVPAYRGLVLTANPGADVTLDENALKIAWDSTAINRNGSKIGTPAPTPETPKTPETSNTTTVTNSSSSNKTVTNAATSKVAKINAVNKKVSKKSPNTGEETETPFLYFTILGAVLMLIAVSKKKYYGND